ncbi:MAG: dethiobiotin synthase [Vulcanococcus sp.]
MSSEPMRLVICGTDTDVGKTVVSALVVQGLGAHYWKPVQCGLEQGEGDRDRVQRWLDWPAERILPEAYRFRDPVSPHWAAELASGDPQQPAPPIDPGRLQLPALAGPLVVETAGGLLVPLRRDLLQIDQLQAWGLPVLLVARSGLGTLNHTLLSLEALRQRQIPLLGVLFNGPPHADNPRTIAELGAVPVLGTLPPLAAVTAATLTQQWQALELSHKLRPLP